MSLPNFLDSIEQAAREKFRAIDTDTDIEAAANLAKTIAEAQKATVEAHNQLRQLKMEGLKSWSLLLVPIVSMLTLLATVIVQAVQIRQQYTDNIRKTEESEWRELLSSVKGTAKNYGSDITVSSRLRVFLTSDRYREQARDLAVRILGNLTNIGTFKELFDATLTDNTPDNLLRTIQVARSLAATKTFIEGQCVAAALKAKFRPELRFGLCTFALDENGFNEFAKATDDYSAAFQDRVALFGAMEALVLVSNKISTLLKLVPNTGASPIDLSNVLVQSANFSDLNFSRIDFRSSAFSMTKLDGAIITPSPGLAPDFIDSEWWNAAVIDGELLKGLIDYRHPYYLGPSQIFPSGMIEESDFRRKVAALCAKAKVTCPTIKYGPPTGASSAIGVASPPLRAPTDLPSSQLSR